MSSNKHLYGPCATTFASGKTGAWRIVKPEVNKEKCILCGICEQYCPTNVITVVKKEGLTIDMDYCKGCGICANVCPKDAMNMVAEREE